MTAGADHPEVRNVLTCGLLALIAIGLTGCGRPGVDEASYVAKNEQVLRSVPVYGHTKVIQDFSKGQEDGPPYRSYMTWRYFQQTQAATCEDVGNWYRDELHRLGWHRAAASGIVGVGYFRDHAFVYLDCGNSVGGG